MSRPDSQRLDDMREQCALITRLVARGRNAFDADEAVRLAMERSMEILGEAANTVGERTRVSHPDVDWSRITRLRILARTPLSPSRSRTSVDDRNRGHTKAGVGTRSAEVT